MSGHSKWASIKHKKAVVDQKRGKLFSRLVKEISAAAKQGGGDPGMNPRLRLAIQTAKEGNLPKDKIDQAIKRGTGELPGVQIEEIVYEGYAPGGVAVLVETVTDNRNRTTAEIRNIFSKRGGNMASAGSVAWQFEQKAVFLVDQSVADEDRLMQATLDAGIEDIALDGRQFTITAPYQQYDAVRQALETAGIRTVSAEITMVPQSYVRVGGPDAKQVLALMDALEEHDDTQNVYANCDIPDEALQAASGGRES